MLSEPVIVKAEIVCPIPTIEKLTLDVQFGPFYHLNEAEKCIVNLSGRSDVLQVYLELLKKKKEVSYEDLKSMFNPPRKPDMETESQEDPFKETDFLKEYPELVMELPVSGTSHQEALSNTGIEFGKTVAIPITMNVEEIKWKRDKWMATIKFRVSSKDLLEKSGY